MQYQWKLAWSLEPYLPAALVLLLFLPRANRKRQAAWVLASLLVSLAIAALYQAWESRVMGLAEALESSWELRRALWWFRCAMLPVTTGFAALMLVTPFVGSSRRLLLLAGAGLGLALARISLWVDPQADPSLVIGIVFALSVAMAFMKGRASERRLRFALIFALLLAVGVLVVTFGYAFWSDLSSVLEHLKYILYGVLEFATTAGAVTVGMLILLLPYLVLLYFSDFYRARLS